MSYKIEKGIPAPVGRTRAAKYPIAELEVGDSFVLESDKEFLSARGAASRIRRASDTFDYTSDATQRRIWRIADRKVKTDGE